MISKKIIVLIGLGLMILWGIIMANPDLAIIIMVFTPFFYGLARNMEG